MSEQTPFLEYWSWAMQWIAAIAIVIALAAIGILLLVLYWIRDEEDIEYDLYDQVEPPPHYPHPKDLACEADEGGRIANAWEDWQKWDRVI